MAYPPRVFIPGASIHVIRRGIARGAIFGDDADRHVLLRIVRATSRKSGVSIHGFALMTTHYHMVVTPHRELALGRMMKAVGEQYVQYYNLRHERFGALFAGRYRAIAICDDRYWLNCLRYIEENPSRAKMVTSPELYPWSSYRVHALGEESDWLVAHRVYVGLGSTDAERQLAYRAICGVALTEDELAELRHPKKKPR